MPANARAGFRITIFDERSRGDNSKPRLERVVGGGAREVPMYWKIDWHLPQLGRRTIIASYTSMSGSNREIIWNELKKSALEAESKFFRHWTLLAGGTFTLLVPFVESLHLIVVHPLYLAIAEIFLVITFFRRMRPLCYATCCKNAVSEYVGSEVNRSEFYWIVKKWVSNRTVVFS